MKTRTYVSQCSSCKHRDKVDACKTNTPRQPRRCFRSFSINAKKKYFAPATPMFPIFQKFGKLSRRGIAFRPHDVRNVARGHGMPSAWRDLAQGRGGDGGCPSSFIDEWSWIFLTRLARLGKHTHIMLQCVHFQHEGQDTQACM